MSELRKIDLYGRPRTPGRKAASPELGWLAIEDLRLDDSYQRGLAPKNWKNIEKIAADFDWARFTPILAAPIGGGLHAIIDGQHRTHAAALRGFDHVPAMVVPMTHAEQARAFAWVNGQVTAITVFHVYKAAMAAMEPWALEVTAAVEAAGCRMMTYVQATQHRKPRAIYVHGLIREHVEAGRAGLVTAVLSALSRAANGDDPGLYASATLKPLLAVLAELPDWRAVDLDGFLDAHDILGLHDNVATMRKGKIEFARKAPSAIYRATLRALLRKHMAAKAA